MPSPKIAARTVVRVSNDAFLTMAFSAAEAGIVPPDLNSTSYKMLAAWEKERGKLPIRQAPTTPPSLIFSETGLETGGVLFGSVERGQAETVFSVERAMSTTCIASDEGIAQSAISPSLLADLAEAAGKPWGTVIGDYHSHPVMAASPRDIMEHQLYSPSELDLEGPLPPHCDVSLIVTVAWARRAKPKNLDQPGLVYKKVGEFAFYLTGYLRRRKWSVDDPMLEINMVR